MPNSLVSVSELNLWLSGGLDCGASAVKVLYTTMHSGPAVKPNIVNNQPRQYIPNSILFDFQTQFADPNSALSNTMCNVKQFQKEADNLGILNDDTLVIYDDFGNFCASRVWFMFKSLGHQNVYLLDGGLPAYLRAALPTSTTLQAATANPQASYCGVEDPKYKFVDSRYVLNNVETKQRSLADARSLERFLGASPEHKANLRAGHIPGAHSIHYASLQTNDGCFLPVADLKSIFEPYVGQSMIFTCGSGVTACILAQAADMVGIQDLSVYDGSWSQWGADEHLPVVVGV